MHDKWLSAEAIRVILLPARTVGNQSNSLGRKPCFAEEARDRGLSRRELNMTEKLGMKRKLAS